jgi:hypothetical protein
VRSNPTHCERQEHRHDGANERSKSDRSRAGNSQGKDEDRSNGRAAGHSKQVRLGERVAQRTLQGGTTRAQTGANQCSEKNSGKPEIANDCDGGWLTLILKRSQHICDRDRNRTASD